jgi:2-iminobutanoate/2-iminopropanoate deaminase
LTAAGLSFDHVVKTTVYMTDLKEFGAMNEVYARFFPKNPPARATVQVASLPRGVKIEIEAIARR